MLEPQQVQARLLRKWPSQVRAMIQGENPFPMKIPLGAPQGQALLHHFPEVRKWVQGLRAWASTHQMLFEETAIHHRQLGEQNVPLSLIIPQADVYLRCVAKAPIFAALSREWAMIQQESQEYKAWFLDNLALIEQNILIWPRIRSVLTTLKDFQGPAIYLRQLSIPEVDTKFIESHRTLLHKALCALLPVGRFDEAARGASTGDFCRKFGFKHDEAIVRFRWLDSHLSKLTLGMTDIATPLSAFATLNPPVDTVFITENKVSGLSFPDAQGAMVIFGLGYGIDVLRHATWLQGKEIFYWGDIDTHGFAMLSRLRRFLPQTRSMLMDEDTFHKHQVFWGHEREPTLEGLVSETLTANERSFCQRLCQNAWGDRLRLEQESVRFDGLLAQVKIITQHGQGYLRGNKR